jgi:hypothetical protein
MELSKGRLALELPTEMAILFPLLTHQVLIAGAPANFPGFGSAPPLVSIESSRCRLAGRARCAALAALREEVVQPYTATFRATQRDSAISSRLPRASTRNQACPKEMAAGECGSR